MSSHHYMQEPELQYTLKGTTNKQPIMLSPDDTYNPLLETQGGDSGREMEPFDGNYDVGVKTSSNRSKSEAF